MNKKGLLISVACSVVLTLALAIYTLVSVLDVKMSDEPKNSTVAVAYRTRDEIKDLSAYNEDSMTFKYSDNENPAISYDETTGKYIAAGAGTVEVVVNIDDKGNTKTYNITVVDQEFDGEGNPINNIAITSRDHLLEYAELANSTESDSVNFRGFTVTLYNDIDLAGINWTPIGTRERPFYGIFNGNGYTIKGMNIHITTENISDFIAIIDNKVTMYVGFFGCVDGLKDETDSFEAFGEINDLNFDSAFIKIDSDVKTAIDSILNEDALNVKTFSQSGIGILAGRIYYSTVSGAENNSTLTNCKIDGFGVVVDETTPNGLGGLVGVMLNSSNIENYNVNITINNDYTAASAVDEKGTILEGNLIGGLVGLVLNNYDGAADSSISNCSVNVKALIKADNMTRFGGAVGALVDATMNNVAINADIKTNTGKTNDEVMYSAVAGAVYYTQGSATIANTTVRIEASVHANVSGFIHENNSTITNSKVEYAAISSFYTNGFAYTNFGTISFDKKFEGVAVNAKLAGFVNSGFVYNNYNTITGYAAAGEVYTPVNVIINSKNKIYGSVQSSNTFSNTVGSAGFANKSEKNTTISNFDVTVQIKNDVNQAGLVFNLGTYNSTEAATLSNMKVNATFTSVQVTTNGKDISTTKYMAGAVARLFGNGTVDNVDVTLNANADADTSKQYGVQFFGGVVARILEDGAVLKNATVSGYAYFNTANYTVSINSANEVATYQSSLIGGLVGAISDDGLSESNGLYTDKKQDQYAKIETVANIVITGNTVENMTIIADIGNNDVITSGKMVSRWRFRALGATIGSINNGDSDLELDSNTLINVTIYTNPNDYNFTTSDSDYKSSLTDSNKSYGFSNIVVSKDAAVTNVKINEL